MIVIIIAIGLADNTVTTRQKLSKMNTIIFSNFLIFLFYKMMLIIIMNGIIPHSTGR